MLYLLQDGCSQTETMRRIFLEPVPRTLAKKLPEDTEFRDLGQVAVSQTWGSFVDVLVIRALLLRSILGPPIFGNFQVEFGLRGFEYGPKPPDSDQIRFLWPQLWRRAHPSLIFEGVT